jgi:3-hydroxyisobutyrate dehydrogenase-like beta-hydroxyacid dehydrogenase
LSDLELGFAGIGRMGFPMAQNLLKAGFPLTVWNRTVERCAPLAEDGAKVALEPRNLAGADIIVTMLSDGAAVWSTLVDRGLLDAMHEGSVVVEMSTIGPKVIAELSAEAEQRGVHLLDAPVSGSVSVAAAGQLFAMVGGDQHAYEQATPVLDAMTKGHILLGPSGAGAAMKLAVNAMIAVTNESVAETLALAERAGIHPERAYDVLVNGALASPFLNYKRGAFLAPESEPVAFTLELMRKDLLLAEELSADVGARLPAAEAAARILDEAIEHGLAQADMARVLSILREEGSSAAGNDERREQR